MPNKIYRVIYTYLMNCIYKKSVVLGKYVNLSRDTRIKVQDDGMINIGERTTTYSNVHFSSIGGKLKIGKDVSFNRNCIVVCRESITIGDNCLFGPNVCVYDHDHEYNSNGICDEYTKSEIYIEKGCWIGAGAIILRGSHIGECTVIGAGTIVKGNIPSHSIVTNNRTIHIKPIINKETDK